MKSIADGFLICFSAFSAIPVPRGRWEGKGLGLAFCFIPLVGIAIGAVSCLWLYAARALEINVLLYAAVAAAIPTIISGGIHMDGFIDTCDAVGSRLNPAEKRAILRDPRAGAFGVMGAVLYFILFAGIYGQFYHGGSVPALLIAFAFARTVAVLASLSLKPADGSSFLAAFSENSSFAVKITLWIYAVCFWCVAFFFMGPGFALAYVLISFPMYLWFASFCRRNFEGISGDTAGFFVSLTELVFVAVAAVGGGLA